MKNKAIFAILVAVMIAVVVIPLSVNDDSEALRGHSNMSLDKESAIVYVSGDGDHSVSFSVTFPDGSNYIGSDVLWKLNDIGDGSDLVSFSQDGDVYTSSGSTVTVYGKKVGSIEVEAYVNNTTDCYASAVVVVFQEKTTPATVFHYYFKIDSNALSQVGATVLVPAGMTLDDFTSGFWISVSQEDYSLAEEFNALSALRWFFKENGWENSIGSTGWINTLLGLGTYSNGNNWIYWAQYHAEGNNTWAFNNTTLGYISTVDSSYIGLIFRDSSSPDDYVPFPGMPENSS